MSDKPKFQLALAKSVAESLCALLAPHCMRVVIVGSIRREKQEVGDIELLILPKTEMRPDGLFDSKPFDLSAEAIDGLLDQGIIAKRPSKTGVFTWGELNRLAVHVESGIPVDFFTEPDERDFNGHGYDQMICTRRLQVISQCEHHMLPFVGHAWIAYIPRRKVVGVSKMSRLLKCFMRRLQIQERLTKQVADAMTKYLNPLGVGVRIVAVHSCMSCRGVMEPESDMVTTALTGCFKEHKVKSEFLSECK